MLSTRGATFPASGASTRSKQSIHALNTSFFFFFPSFNLHYHAYYLLEISICSFQNCFSCCLKLPSQASRLGTPGEEHQHLLYTAQNQHPEHPYRLPGCPKSKG